MSLQHHFKKSVFTINNLFWCSLNLNHPNLKINTSIIFKVFDFQAMHIRIVFPVIVTARNFPGLPLPPWELGQLNSPKSLDLFGSDAWKKIKNICFQIVICHEKKNVKNRQKKEIQEWCVRPEKCSDHDFQLFLWFFQAFQKPPRIRNTERAYHMVNVGAKLPTKDGAHHKLKQNLPATDWSQPSRNLSWEFCKKTGW